MADEFKNLRQAVQFLVENGYKISQSTIYKHQNEGKIRPDKGSVYTKDTVLKYAKRWLDLETTRQTIDTENLVRQKTMAEIARITEHAKLTMIRRMIEEGKWIPRDDFELELASRAAALQKDFTQMVQTQAGHLIDVVHGDTGYMQDLIRELAEQFGQMLNRYADTKENLTIFQPTGGE